MFLCFWWNLQCVDVNGFFFFFFNINFYCDWAFLIYKIVFVFFYGETHGGTNFGWQLLQTETPGIMLKVKINNWLEKVFSSGPVALWRTWERPRSVTPTIRITVTIYSNIILYVSIIFPLPDLTFIWKRLYSHSQL